MLFQSQTFSNDVISNIRSAMRRPNFWVIGAFLTLIGLFFAFPQMDIVVSSLFFDGEKFPLRKQTVMRVLSNVWEHGTEMLWLIAVLYSAGALILKKGLRFTILDTHKRIIYVLATFAVMKILVRLCKVGFMRCRPYYIDAFNGPVPFTAPWTANNHPLANIENCLSFFSFHSTCGFFFMVPAFIYPAGSIQRRNFFIFGMVMGCIYGLTRIMMGMHFLSDVIFAGFLTYFAAVSVAVVLKPHVSARERENMWF